MRITCPLCGERDLREFSYTGSDDYLKRPDHEASIDALDAHLHLRTNPAGETRDLWYHDACGAWIVAERNTITHEIHATTLVAEAGA